MESHSDNIGKLGLLQRAPEITLPRVFDWNKDDFGSTKKVILHRQDLDELKMGVAKLVLTLNTGDCYILCISLAARGFEKGSY